MSGIVKYGQKVGPEILNLFQIGRHPGFAVLVQPLVRRHPWIVGADWFTVAKSPSRPGNSQACVGRLPDQALMVLTPITSADPRAQAAKRLNQDRSPGIDEICKTLRISRSTFYHYLALHNDIGEGFTKYPEGSLSSTAAN